MPEPDIRAHLFARSHTNIATAGHERGSLSQYLEQEDLNPIVEELDLQSADPGSIDYKWFNDARILRLTKALSGIPHSRPNVCIVVDDYPARAPEIVTYGSAESAGSPSASDNTQTIPAALHANWAELARSGLSNDGFERLRMLAAVKDGWRGDAARALAASSLHGLLAFWRLVKGVAVEPELMLTARGTVQAEWHRSHRQFLDIEFKTNGREANFGLFDRGHTLEGTLPLNEVRAQIASYREGIAFRWGN